MDADAKLRLLNARMERPARIASVAHLPPMRMTCAEFRALSDYSHSFPTGQTPGKRWRRQVSRGGRWVIGVYVRDPVETHIGIRWYRPVVRP